MARNGVSELMPEELKPYLKYSVGLHVAAAVAALRLLSGAAVKPGQVYTIDFVGPSAMISSQAQSEAEKSAASAVVDSGKPPPDAQFDEFGRRKKHAAFVLPRPSLLKGFQAQEPEKQQTASGPTTQAPAAGASSAEGGGGPAGTGIETDMPNFPYPWYISQVRAALWNQWSARMPKEQGSCTIVFSILPNGSIVDLRAEDSSGSSAFDLTAESAVQDATPFAPLPREFHEPFLKIHVTLKSQ
ncbi:MAG: TonB C-terminal domain-containing protein [Elusimicrobia bacterium]|nr:TonB C-terminal domain-containing protein [Elusimicrobiota bacterium]